METSVNSATRATELRASPLVSPTVQRWAPPIVLFVLACIFVGLHDPLHRPLFRDAGIFAYLSQLVTQGLAPHRDAFNEQASLTFLVGGAAMWLGNLFGIHPLISFRLTAMAALGGVAALTYVVGKFYTRSTWVAFTAGLILLGFQGYVLRSAVALEPKSLMLVFGLASLYFLHERRWFWAGALACAAALAWQVAGIYLLVALALALMQGGILLQERARAVALTAAAAAGVFGIYFLYFFLNNAHIEMLQQTFLAPSLMHRVSRMTTSARLERMVTTFYRGFHEHVVFGILGALGLMLDFGTMGYAKKWQAIPLRVGDALLQNPRTAGVLLTTLAFIAMGFADFQNYPDWIPLLPFISIFAALFLYRVASFVMQRAALVNARRGLVFAAVALVVLAASTFQTASAARRPLRNTWQEQQAIADDLNRVIPANAPIWILSKADLLFFMKRQNPNKYIYFLGQIDAAADLFDPGGFAAMFNNTMATKPVLYVLGRLKPGKFSTRANFDLVSKSTKAYVRLSRCHAIGSGAYYAPPAVAADRFAKERGGCLTNPPPKK